MDSDANASTDDPTIDDPSYRIAWGVQSKAEHRWPASMSILLAMIIYIALPDRYTVGPPWLIPALELAIVLPLSVSAPKRVAHEGRFQQSLAIIMIAILNIANLASLFLLIQILLYHGKDVAGPELFFSSLDIWITNVIVFALWYWEIDRGGPDQRAKEHHNGPDFLFPQMSTPGCSRPDWTPRYIDYLYLAFTNATAFSPTDVMPLSRPAKTLMLVQSSISLITVTLVAARAVNILS
ncbi:MAG TPA: DUF1345 domain-containing protein [Planktothrix sp.]|jgi:uncharacterized membrane protein